MLEQSFPLLQTTQQKPRVLLDTVVPFGRACHYPMDGSTIIPGSGLVDTAGGFNNGTFVGATVPRYSDTDGGSGPGGLRFTNGGGYVSFPYPASIPTGGAARSFCCWVYPINYTTYIVPIQYGVSAANTQFQIYIDKDTHTLNMASGGGGANLVTSTATIPAGSWSHIGWTSFDGGASGAYFWINGVFENKTGFTLNTTATTLHYINFDGTTIYGDCVMRDWRVYSIGLNFGEFQAIMSAGMASGLTAPYLGQAESPVMAQLGVGLKPRSYGYII